MINPVVLIGEPLFFKDKLFIYPPKVKDVVCNPKLLIYERILTLTQEDIQEELQKEGIVLEHYPTPFEFLLSNCYNNENVRNLTIEAFEFFCHVKITFLFGEKKIVVGDLKQKMLNGEKVSEIQYLLEEEYFSFQNMIRISMGNNPIEPPEPPNPDENPAVRRIKELARKRDRIKAKQKRKDGISTSTCLTAICCMGIGITPLNIGEMSYAAVGELMKMM